jgi:hypothetical protein
MPPGTSPVGWLIEHRLRLAQKRHHNRYGQADQGIDS